MHSDLFSMGMGHGMVYMHVGHHKVVKLMTGGGQPGAGLGHGGQLPLPLPPTPTWIRPWGQAVEQDAVRLGLLKCNTEN